MLAVKRSDDYQVRQRHLHLAFLKNAVTERNKKTLKRVFFSYLKKIYIPPNAKNSTPPTNAMVGKTFARINAVVPFPLIFLCCLAKLIAFI